MYRDFVSEIIFKEIIASSSFIWILDVIFDSSCNVQQYCCAGKYVYIDKVVFRLKMLDFCRSKSEMSDESKITREETEEKIRGLVPRI
jgi:hypothetical protein